MLTGFRLERLHDCENATPAVKPETTATAITTTRIMAITQPARPRRRLRWIRLRRRV